MSTLKLRRFILIGWSMSLFLIVTAYVAGFFWWPVRPPMPAMLTSIGAVIGLLAPHLTMAYDFVLSDGKKSARKVDSTLAYSIIAMCSAYWVIFVLLIWTGIFFREFSDVPDGRGIELTTSVAIAISGILSFLVVRPTSKLFSLSK